MVYGALDQGLQISSVEIHADQFFAGGSVDRVLTDAQIFKRTAADHALVAAVEIAAADTAAFFGGNVIEGILNNLQAAIFHSTVELCHLSLCGIDAVEVTGSFIVIEVEIVFKDIEPSARGTADSAFLSGLGIQITDLFAGAEIELPIIVLQIIHTRNFRQYLHVFCIRIHKGDSISGNIVDSIPVGDRKSPAFRGVVAGEITAVVFRGAAVNADSRRIGEALLKSLGKAGRVTGSLAFGMSAFNSFLPGVEKNDAGQTGRSDCDQQGKQSFFDAGPASDSLQKRLRIPKAFIGIKGSAALYKTKKCRSDLGGGFLIFFALSRGHEQHEHAQ